MAPLGQVLGLDANADLIAEARRLHGTVPNLSFEVADLYTLPCRSAFDLVSAARVLQWLARPLDALRMLVAAVKPGGRVILLDYNHEKIAWHPPPPASMRSLYAAFLRWRAEAGMDSAIADHLADLCVRAGLVEIVATPQPEVSQRTDPDFATRLVLWAEVAATRGRQMVADGVISEPERRVRSAGAAHAPLRIDWYVTCLDLGPWGALYTEGWDRRVVARGETAKRTKQGINCRRIYPPRSRDRHEIFAAAAPIVQTPPLQYH